MQNGRLESLQALRFFAAFLVIVYHANIFVQDYSSGSLQRIRHDTLSMIAEIGRSGVPIFFVISGFIMMHISGANFGQPGAPRRFVFNRVSRIYPVYWMVLMAWLMLEPYSRAPFQQDFFSTAGILALWPSYADQVVSVAWTLSFEMYFYALFALALFLPRKIGLPAITLAIVASVAMGKMAGWSAETPSGEATYGSELLLFLAGMGICGMCRGIAANPGRWTERHRNIGMAVGLLWLGLTPLMQDAGLPAIAVYGPAAIVLVAACAFSDVAGNTLGLARRFTFLGDSSYSLYLTHILTMILAKPMLVKIATLFSMGPAMLILLLSFVSVLAGAVFYLIFERPTHSWLRQRKAALSDQTS